jgi:hypothetical protein
VDIGKQRAAALQSLFHIHPLRIVFEQCDHGEME